MELESFVSNTDFCNLVIDYVPKVVVGRSFHSHITSAVDLYTREAYTDCASVSRSLLDYCWERLNIGNWKDVHVSWRYAYTIASILRALSEYNLLICGDTTVSFDDVMKSCDMGLLMGAPLRDNILATISTSLQTDFCNRNKAGRLKHEHTDKHVISDMNIKRSAICQGESTSTTGNDDLLQTSPAVEDDSRMDINRPCSCSNVSVHTASESDNTHADDDTHCSTKLVNMSKAVARCSCPSLETFRRDFMTQERPVIITNAMSFWPALSNRRWTLDYIKKIAGCRTVPIEIGSKYTDDAWSQSLMTVREFIEKYIERERSMGEVGYLAQHQLFNQIPELEEDIITPDYCYLGSSDECVDINAWFGPEGTVSPLHYDPKHNFLAQIMGEKYIRLYPESETTNLYPHNTTLLKNTSQVDVENPDYVKFTEFPKAAYTECVLKSGEMLYLPPKYWHFVKSLSLSFSVSFWWK